MLADAGRATPLELEAAEASGHPQVAVDARAFVQPQAQLGAGAAHETRRRADRTAAVLEHLSCLPVGPITVARARASLIPPSQVRTRPRPQHGAQHRRLLGEVPPNLLLGQSLAIPPGLRNGPLQAGGSPRDGRVRQRGGNLAAGCVDIAAVLHQQLDEAAHIPLGNQAIGRRPRHPVADQKANRRLVKRSEVLRESIAQMVEHARLEPTLARNDVLPRAT